MTDEWQLINKMDLEESGLGMILKINWRVRGLSHNS
jgi:hypothetical protein